MKPATAARLVHLYPSLWRARYGAEFAALLEDHPMSFRTFSNVAFSAVEAHMTSSNSAQREPAALSGIMWWAWMLAVAAGMILYGTVDDSPFVAAMHSNSFFNGCWIGIEIGSVIASAAIVLGGVPIAWSMVRHILTARRRDILWRLAFPFFGALVVLGWVVTVLVWTGGRWAASPWAVVFSNPNWPPEGFRWTTGSISAFLMLFAFAGSAVTVAQALHRSEFNDVQLSLAGVKLYIKPLRLAALLMPWATSGTILMLVSVALWGFAASRNASDAFHGPFGPLGFSSYSSWLTSVVLFGVAAALSARAAWRSMAIRFDTEHSV